MSVFVQANIFLVLSWRKSHGLEKVFCNLVLDMCILNYFKIKMLLPVFVHTMKVRQNSFEPN